MNDQHIARLEAHLERLVEGAFAHVFGRKVRAQDIALQLARAMEDGLRAPQMGDPRAFAPDHYTILLNPEACLLLAQRQPALAQVLSQHLVELATHAGYRLNNTPVIQISPDAKLATNQVIVQSSHVGRRESVTQAMKPVTLPEGHNLPHNPQLLINNQRAIPLLEGIINIGRGHANHIILDDPAVSRHHAQLRVRFGRYTLFDANSQSGTFANEVRVREHRLQSGDVIRVGNTQMVYLEDDPLSDSQTEAIDAT